MVMKGKAALFSSDSDEWRTPKDLFNELNKKFKFECDVAATNDNRLCEWHYSKLNNGLENNWHTSNWCNPPYSQLAKWIAKADLEAEKGNLTVMLIPARTDTKAFHAHIYKKWHVQFLKGRLKFSDSKNSAPFPSMLVYFGVPA